MLLTNRLRGITLIEVIIAVYVFGIGILVILKMVISNITRVYDIRTKDTAVSLAKEGIDLVFHQRDSNIEKGMPWYCASVVFSGGSRACERSFLNGGSSGTFLVNRTTTGLYYFEPLVTTSAALLRYHSGIVYSLSGTDFSSIRYNHENTGGSISNFYRRIHITPVLTYPSYTGYILQVHSIVQYTRGTVARQIILESMVGDIR